MFYVPKCSCCKVGNIREEPEFDLCPNCLRDIKALLATLLKLSDAGKEAVDRDELFVEAERARLRQSK